MGKLGFTDLLGYSGSGLWFASKLRRDSYTAGENHI